MSAVSTPSRHGHAVTAAVSYIVIWYNLGAVVGAILFGHLSEALGRRRSMTCALILSLATIPDWAFGGILLIIAAAAFLMQAGVQGAWRVIATPNLVSVADTPTIPL
jgi:MFS family permease